ncbi:hypothetical protein A2U01_0026223, partial [Trifolium medium]|nr:hypothetical protein [Trifolium medium]
SMKTISEEQLQAFILKAREKKSRSQATAVPDPLPQLVVDDLSSKGSKRKSQEETARISIQVPKKGEDANTEGHAPNVLVSPAKKKRVTRGTTGRSLLQVPRPVCCKKSKRSKVSPLSFWDAYFNSLCFIEEQFEKHGDPSSFSQTTFEELMKMSLGYQLRGTMLSYLLSTRQELELIEANNKMKVIDDNLGSIEKEYSATKMKLEKDLKELKAEYEHKLEQLAKDKEEKWARDRKTFT